MLFTYRAAGALQNPLPCGRGSDVASQTLTGGRQSRDRRERVPRPNSHFILK